MTLSGIMEYRWRQVNEKGCGMADKQIGPWIVVAGIGCAAVAVGLVLGFVIVGLCAYRELSGKERVR